MVPFLPHWDRVFVQGKLSFLKNYTKWIHLKLFFVVVCTVKKWQPRFIVKTCESLPFCTIILHCLPVFIGNFKVKCLRIGAESMFNLKQMNGNMAMFYKIVWCTHHSSSKVKSPVSGANRLLNNKPSKPEQALHLYQVCDQGRRRIVQLWRDHVKIILSHIHITWTSLG